MEAVQQALRARCSTTCPSPVPRASRNITGARTSPREVTHPGVKDAAGEEAEIIFGTVSDPAMHGEIRVTVIATGFDKLPATTDASGRVAPGVLPFRERAARPTPGPVPGYVKPAETGGVTKRPVAQPPVADVNELEIPTFIRRQMD